MSTSRDKPRRTPQLPIAPPPPRRDEDEPGRAGPDLHLEEVEEKHLPRDRNIFDK